MPGSPFSAPGATSTRRWPGSMTASTGLFSGGDPNAFPAFVPIEFLYNQYAIIVGLVYVGLPFLVLPLYASLEKFDRSFLEASLDLGASQWQTFFQVLVPHRHARHHRGIAAGLHHLARHLSGARCPRRHQQRDDRHADRPAVRRRRATGRSARRCPSCCCTSRSSCCGSAPSARAAKRRERISIMTAVSDHECRPRQSACSIRTSRCRWSICASAGCRPFWCSDSSSSISRSWR